MRFSTVRLPCHLGPEVPFVLPLGTLPAESREVAWRRWVGREG